MKSQHLFNMHISSVAWLSFGLVLLILSSLFTVVLADYPAVVKAGDWADYKVEYKSDVPMRTSRNITQTRIDIIDADDGFILLNLSRQYVNGTSLVKEILINQYSGSFGYDVVLPLPVVSRNLNVGDKIYDQYQGYLTISGEQKMSFGGAERNVILGYGQNTTYYWDRETGVLVNATSTITRYTVKAILVSTNIWQPEISGLAPVVSYSAVAGITVALVIVVMVTVVFVLRRVKRAKRFRNPVGKGAYWQREFESAESK
jgi:hypothetical protein